MTSKLSAKNKRSSASATRGHTVASITKSRQAKIDAYVAANTATPEVARAKLQQLGIVGTDGKLTKPYR